MFSLVMSSVPTPRKAPPSRKNEKFRAPGSCGSCASSASSAFKLSLLAEEVSCAYTIPPAIALAATVSAINNTSFLRDMSIYILRKDFDRFHAQDWNEFQIFWTSAATERGHPCPVFDVE